MLDLLSEAMKIEIIRDVFLVHFCEEFMAFQVAKPLDPAIARFTVIVVIQVLVYIACNCRVRLGTNIE